MAERVVVIPNGFDEDSFNGVARPGMASVPLNPGMITLLHSGIVYRDERDPSCLFAALRQLIDAQVLHRDRIRIRFRAPGPDSMLRMLMRRHALEDVVELVPPVSYREAIMEMVRADGLLVLQASNCNEQVPAKLYEYLRAGRPIAALTDPAGDTAGVLRDAGLDTIARLDSVDDIAAMLGSFVEALRLDRAVLPQRDYVAGASRAKQTQSLAALLERTCASL
jgi:glycosyltransferase involved in cell wall biosynthesis